MEDIADDLIKLYAGVMSIRRLPIQDDENQEGFLNKIFHILKQMINYVPLKKLKKIWNRIVRWTDCWLERRFWENRGRYTSSFKAVNDHKQVAVLVPTTVLAQQRYANFKGVLNLLQ